MGRQRILSRSVGLLTCLLWACRSEPLCPSAFTAETPTLAARTPARASAAAAPAGELLVRVPRRGSAPEAAEQRRAIERELGPVVERCGSVAGSDVYRVALRPQADVSPTTLDRLEILAQANFSYRLHATPDDTRFNEQWSLAPPAPGQGGLAATEAWPTTTGNAAVLIGVVDSGVDLDHPDLVGNLWKNPGETAGNGSDDDGNGYIDDATGIDALLPDAVPPQPAGTPADDAKGHGTAVASVAAAVTDNGQGIAGIAWQAGIVPCRMTATGVPPCTCRTVKCLDYLRRLRTDQHHNVVAVSFSVGGQDYDPLVRDAIADLGAAGILFVASAGNDGSDTDSTPQYPSSYQLPNILAVAATTHDDQRHPESNCGGASIHVAAPGEGIWALQPDSTPATFGGTSLAASHVTGLLALLAAADLADDGVQWDWRALRNRVIAGGDQVGALHFTSLSQRRLRAAQAGCAPGAGCTGALTCAEQYVHRRVLPRVTNEVDGRRVALAQKGSAITLAALSINCEAPDGPVKVVIGGPSGSAYEETVTLQDVDQLPDFAKDDGIFAAQWTPPAGMAEFTLDYLYGTNEIDDSADGAFDQLVLQIVDTLPPPDPRPCPP